MDEGCGRCRVPVLFCFEGVLVGVRGIFITGGFVFEKFGELFGRIRNTYCLRLEL